MKETETPENSSSEDDVSNDNEPESQRAHETEHNSSTQHDEESLPDTIVKAEATNVACSIVKIMPCSDLDVEFHLKKSV